MKYFKTIQGGFFVEVTKKINGIVVGISNKHSDTDIEITEEEYRLLLNDAQKQKINFQEQNKNVLSRMQ